MTISIDATYAGESSNSYITVAGADSYFEAVIGFSTIWTAFSDAVKKQYLVQSTRAIDRLPIMYCKFDPDQALEFPRDVFLTNHVDEIEPKIKDAQCEMIRYLQATVSSTNSTATERDIASVDVSGVVALEYSSSKNTQAQLAAGGSLQAVKALLRPYLSSDSTIPLLKY